MASDAFPNRSWLKIKNRKKTENLKTIRGPSSNYALPNHTTFSRTQTVVTVPLNYSLQRAYTLSSILCSWWIFFSLIRGILQKCTVLFSIVDDCVKYKSVRIFMSFPVSANTHSFIVCSQRTLLISFSIFCKCIQFHSQPWWQASSRVHKPLKGHCFRKQDISEQLYPYLFAAVPGSSINSWDSWFIFNLRKNKHLLLHDTLYMGRDKRVLCCCKKVCAYIGNATIVVSWMLVFSAILAIYGQ
jgi:hypothetical protein